jgi:hypothetical protein
MRAASVGINLIFESKQHVYPALPLYLNQSRRWKVQIQSMAQEERGRGADNTKK